MDKLQALKTDFLDSNSDSATNWLVSSVTLVNPSEPQFPYLKNGTNLCTFHLGMK